MQQGRPSHEIYRELVPLAEAAAAAWHIITERPAPLKDPHALEEARGLVAVALSSVAPVLKGDSGAAVPLTGPEVSERLFVRNGAADLDGLYMRRVDLLRAVELLREAHIAFDRQGALEGLRRT